MRSRSAGNFDKNLLPELTKFNKQFPVLRVCGRADSRKPEIVVRRLYNSRFSLNPPLDSLIIDHWSFSPPAPPALGNVNENLAPAPTSLFTQTSPPWACTICFTMANPSPVPPVSR